MRTADPIREGEHVMTVCNACRYCEEYCPVFPAMERRLTFAKGDLVFLANLCHNCGECLYACQYAPPHGFAINVPRTLARIRGRSYEEHCWPSVLGGRFRRNGVETSLFLTLALSAMTYAATAWSGAGRLWQPHPRGDFYAVVPHDVMVGLFGSVSVVVAIALVVATVRFWRGIGPSRTRGIRLNTLAQALRDVLTLRHLHADDGVDCASAEDARAPWRRWFHHGTFYGLLLCAASTSVAAFYHAVLGWHAPYEYWSLPVALGAAGGLGLLVGPAGLLVLQRKRDVMLRDPAQAGLDGSLLVLLFMASLTGLLLLFMREGAAMGILLIIHLSVVLALLVTLPYGKFIHGIYRAAALLRDHMERTRDDEPAAI